MNRVIFRQACLEDIPAMSKIRLAVTENALSDPSRITQQMYEDYLGHGSVMILISSGKLFNVWRYGFPYGWL